MIKINVILNNKGWSRYIKDPTKFIEKKVNNINKNFNKYKKNYIFLTLLLSGESEIKKLNHKFRKKNNHTDVLSFPSFVKTDLKKELKKKEIYLGDIIISYQYIFPNKKNLILEMTFIHGFLHLLGFDHKKIKDFKIMNREENKILNSIS